MIIEKNQIFNLMDTNGRRNDVINALQGYLTILDDIQNSKKLSWDSMPDSLAQYEFYKQAIELSPNVFKEHKPYDNLKIQLNNNKSFLEAIDNYDQNWINQNAIDYSELISKFDLGIEDRARHYTSTLVKLGFSYNNRKITPVGELLLDLSKIKKDKIEKMLPIDVVNIVYLRQCLKLRLFDKNKELFYSPFNLAIYILLIRQRISETDFLEIIQGISPYSSFDNLDEYIINYKVGNIVSNIEIDIPNEIDTHLLLEKTIFEKYYKNRKSNMTINTYWEFYNLLWKCKNELNGNNIDNLLKFYEDNLAIINKAFGCGEIVFKYEMGERPDIENFLKQTKNLFEGNFNINLYKSFCMSKQLDQIREYSDTTKRIFKATGIISFENGYAELAYRELCESIFDITKIRNRVFGNIKEEIHTHYDNYMEYEGEVTNYFCKVTSVLDILDYYTKEINNVEEKIQTEFPGIDITNVPNVVANRRKDEFDKFVSNVYPIEKVKYILSLFSDRNNDKEIKELVCQDATVSTIYEFIVGIAWYYFSGKRIDILKSFNLTLSADFEPLIHAGGGKGDIVIYEMDKVTMLEATLMNENSQKRGEWEPVLRHSINLKIEEETNNPSRMVTTFFIADSFDLNSINIWKAVATVPLQSSINKDRFTDNVIIMPLSTKELSDFIDRYDKYDEIISCVHKLFDVDKKEFDLNWRNKFISEII